MKRLMALTVLLVAASTSAQAGGYGTIIHKDGTMTVIYTSNKVGFSYAVNFSKKGKVTGGCKRESMAAYQLRKARMRAASKWRLGYIAKKFPCT